MCILIVFGIVMLLYCLMMLYRNDLVYKIRLKEIDNASAKAREDIRNGVPDWERHYAKHDASSYGIQLYDLRKWKYEDFFPEERALKGEK